MPLSPTIWDEEKEPTSSRLVWTTKQDPVSTITAAAAAATERNSSSNFRAGDQFLETQRGEHLVSCLRIIYMASIQLLLYGP